MALQILKTAVGNLQDDASGNNYAVAKPVYILNLNKTLATIYSDENGTIPITQDGVNNVSDSRGTFICWVEAGDYIQRVGGIDERVSITGADYFNNRVDQTVNDIIQEVANREINSIVGSFEDGFTYTDVKQLGSYGTAPNIDYYVFTGGIDDLPHSVAAATNPESNPLYQKANFNASSNVVNDDGLSQQNINDFVIPAIITDSAATSRSGISSSDPTDFKQDELNELLSSKKYVTIDTPIYLNGSVEAVNENSLIQCNGAGILYAGDDGLDTMSTEYLIKVQADNVVLRNLRMDNPSELKAQSGGRQGGIITYKDNLVVENAIMHRMLQGVSANFGSNTNGTIVKFCKFLEMLGAGDGSASSSSNGEDRGDAVTIWGRDAKIIGNSARLKWGQDGRVAFHVESLDNSNEQTNALIALNTAMGQYRRHYVMENVNRGQIVNNISGGIDQDNPTNRQGATWFSAALIQATQCDIKDLIVLWDRTSADTQGSVWNPIRSAISMINFSDDCSISRVNVKGASSSVGSVLSGTESGSGHMELSIDNIKAKSLNTEASRGLQLTAFNNPTVTNIELDGYSDSIYSFRNSGGFSLDKVKATNCTRAVFAEYLSTDDSDVTIKNIEVDGTSSAGGAVQIVGDALSVSIDGAAFKNVTGRDFESFNFGSLTLRNIENKDNTGLIRLYGSTSGSFKTDDAVDFDYTSVKGYTSEWQHQSLGSATNKVNTEGKHRGLIVWAGGEAYTAKGFSASSDWVQLGNGTVITPA